MNLQQKVLSGHLKRIETRFKEGQYAFPSWIFHQTPPAFEKQVSDWQSRLFTELGPVRAARLCANDMLFLSEYLNKPETPAKQAQFLKSVKHFFETLNKLLLSFLQNAAPSDLSDMDKQVIALTAHNCTGSTKDFATAYSFWTKTLNINSLHHVIQSALQQMLIQGFSNSDFVASLNDLCCFRPLLFNEVFGTTIEEQLLGKLAKLVKNYFGVPELITYEALEHGYEITKTEENEKIMDSFIADGSDILSVDQAKAKKLAILISTKLERANDTSAPSNEPESDEVGGGFLNSMISGALGVSGDAMKGTKSDPYKGLKDWLGKQSRGEDDEDFTAEERLLGAADEDEYDEDKQLEEEMRQFQITEDFGEFLDPHAIKSWVDHQRKTNFAGVLARLIDHMRGTANSSKIISSLVPESCKALLDDKAFRQHIQQSCTNINFDKLTDELCAYNPKLGGLLRLAKKLGGKLLKPKVVRVKG